MDLLEAVSAADRTDTRKAHQGEGQGSEHRRVDRGTNATMTRVPVVVAVEGVGTAHLGADTDLHREEATTIATRNGCAIRHCTLPRRSSSRNRPSCPWCSHDLVWGKGKKVKYVPC